MSRLPLRVRLTLAFALAMAVVLAATGAFVYLRLGSSLDEAIRERLDTRLSQAAALAERGARVPPGGEDAFAAVLAPSGPAGRRLDVPTVGGGTVQFDRSAVPGVDGQARLLARAVQTPGGRRVVVVAESLEDRDDALHGLLVQLSIVGPAALVLASLLAYALATAALRPVESMRAEAAAISAAEPGRRLPVPPARDEIGRLATTLNNMLERLEAALEHERRFVAEASHELRTPLALLKAELELALRRPRSASELEQALRSAAAESDRLARLAEDLLVLARSDRGGIPLRRESVEADEVVAAVAERFAPRAEASERAIEVEAPDGLRLAVDRLRIEQALGNLVANALEHGGGPIRCSVSSVDSRVEFHVVDQGPGFPEAFLPKAFERFSRADEARSGGGAGLGLAIAEVIARAHGGSVQAVNRAGGGADVWLSLPRP